MQHTEHDIVNIIARWFKNSSDRRGGRERRRKVRADEDDRADGDDTVCNVTFLQ